LATFAVAGASLLTPAAAASQGTDARLQGTFALTGRVTVAVAVPGEHRGQTVSRRWTFTPACSAPVCATVRLRRQRAGGTDKLVLHRRSAGYYSGAGRFYAPLNCGGQIVRQGETVPFTVTVRITATTPSPGGPIASRLRATYTNRKRLNRTNCVLPPSRDAAAYHGQLSSQSQSISPLRPASA
jgi:hypothetical protein